jgi:hypothetical protein
MDQPNLRFSDEKLDKFYSDFKQHQLRCEERFDECDDLVRDFIEIQQRNTQAITALTQETRAIVQLHKDFQGAARLGTSFQKFIIWLGKWGAIGVGIATALTFIANKVLEIGIK